MREWIYGDVVKPRDGRMYPLGRFMYVGPGSHPLSFTAICIREAPDDPNPMGVRRFGGMFTDWNRTAFERVIVDG
jgi:hypothetical protein